jgi:adenylate cyclase
LGNVEAYDLFLRGVAEFRRWDDGANRRARVYFEQAIAVDPDLAAAHAAYSTALLIENGFANASQEIKALALEQARLAVRLDARDGRCQSALGWAYRCTGEFELAKSHMEQGLKLNPNHAGTHADLANILAILGKPEEGVAAMMKAMELNPYHPDWYWSALSICLFACRRYEEVLAASARLGNAKTPWTLAREAACLAELGRMEEASRTVSEVLRLQPDFRITTELPNYQRASDRDHVRDTMKKAGLPE